MKIRTLKLACAALDSKRFPRSSRPEIAVAGRSNVGKSSLLNTILGRRDAARISKQPGKTQTVNFYIVNDRFYLVDLPGYGYARVSEETRRKWRQVIFSYIENRKGLLGVVQLIDARHPPSPNDIVMLQHLVDAGRPFLVVLTKADKVKRSERKKMLGELRGCFDADITVQTYRARDEAGVGEREHSPLVVPVLFFSTKTGEGKDNVRRWIEESME